MTSERVITSHMGAYLFWFWGAKAYNVDACSLLFLWLHYLTWRVGYHSTRSDTFLVLYYPSSFHWKAARESDMWSLGLDMSAEKETAGKSKITPSNIGIFVLMRQNTCLIREKVMCPVI